MIILKLAFLFGSIVLVFSNTAKLITREQVHAMLILVMALCITMFIGLQFMM